jgi:hypothetical protein
MQYKAIVLELLQGQHPRLHERLRTRRMLLTALGEYGQANPNGSPMEIASIILEAAIDDLQQRLRYDSPQSPPEAGISLEATITSLPGASSAA